MKGVVFTELMEMVEERFGYEMVDKIVSQPGIQSGGVFTSVGTYPFSEMAILLSGLHKETGLEIPALLREFGGHIFQRFVNSYGVFFENVPSAFDFLLSIDNYIHVEVLKLYPDAELPKFNGLLLDEKTLQLDYFSERRLGDFAEGLLLATFRHFKEDIRIRTEKIDASGAHIRFFLTKND